MLVLRSLAITWIRHLSLTIRFWELVSLLPVGVMSADDNYHNLKVLHPSLRVGYLEDIQLWPTGNLAMRAHILLEHIYTVYSDDSISSSSHTSTVTAMTQSFPSKHSVFLSAVKQHTNSSTGSTAGKNEVDVYLSGLYPSTSEQEENLLLWWKVC
jgi:hypothetical protein